jgi:hypothetical protein
MFEIATKKKFRFPFRGMISTEDLWDLSLTDLDAIYKTLNAQKKAKADEDSLLSTKTNEDIELNLKIDIVKHIVSVKLEEKAAKDAERAKSIQKQKIMSILAEKEDEALHGKSIEELQKMLGDLD